MVDFVNFSPIGKPTGFSVNLEISLEKYALYPAARSKNTSWFQITYSYKEQNYALCVMYQYSTVTVRPFN